MNFKLLTKTRELKTSQERIEGSSTATQSCSVSFHRLFEMQGRANLLQTEFNRAFQPGSQTEAFFDTVNDNDRDLNTKIDGWNTVQIVPIL